MATETPNPIMMIRFPAELRLAIRELARNEGNPESAVVRRLVSAALAASGRPLSAELARGRQRGA